MTARQTDIIIGCGGSGADDPANAAQPDCQSSATEIDADAVIARVARRIVPLVALGYFVAFLDRTNLAMAGLTMGRDLGFTARTFGWGAGIFFLGYVLFEVPSNLVLTRFGARIWIARIMVTWGMFSIAMAWVWNSQSFYSARFLLGVAEAGFVPGLIYYLACWFPRGYRTRIFGLFLTAQPLASVIGNPIGGLILRLNGILGLHGWQWIFILEGIPAIILGVLIFRYLPGQIAHASWLTQGQRDWLEGTLAAERREAGMARADSLRTLMGSGRLWLLTLTYLSIVCGSYGVVFWLPQILDGSLGGNSVVIGFLSAIPWLCAIPGMVYWTSRSDRTQQRAWHVGVASLCGFLGLATAAYVSSPAVSLFGLTAAMVGILSATATFWSLPTALMTGKYSAAGIAFINAVASIGGFIGPYAIGRLKDVTGAYTSGLWALAGCELLAALVAFWFRRRESTMVVTS